MITFSYCKKCGLVYFKKPFAMICRVCHGDLDTLFLPVGFSEDDDNSDQPLPDRDEQAFCQHAMNPDFCDICNSQKG